MKKLIYLLLAIVLIFSISSLAACGGDDDDEKTASPQSTTQESEQTPTKVQPTQTDKPTIPGMGELSDVVSMDDLKSYKMHMVMNVPMVGDMTTDMTVVNDPPPKASHTVTDMVMASTEMITIGDKSWIKMGDEGWMESPVSESGTQESTDFSDYLDDIDTDVDYIGKEKVNGVNCKHYNVEMDVSLDFADPQTGAAAEYSAHFTGEVWVADESGLPKVMVRQAGTMEMEMAGSVESMDIELNITNINDSSISVSPPPADQIITMPDIGDIGDISDFIPESGSFEVPFKACSEYATGSQEWLDCMMETYDNQ